jgi:hypothetical protein
VLTVGQATRPTHNRWADFATDAPKMGCYIFDVTGASLVLTKNPRGAKYYYKFI